MNAVIKGAKAEDLPERISEMLGKLRDIEKELAAVRSAQALAQVAGLVAKAKNVGKVSLIAEQLSDEISGEDVRTMALDLRNRVKDSVIALISNNSGKPVVVVAVSDSARSNGAKAGALVKIASTTLGGGGGGKDDFAQGGGVDVSKTSEALTAIEKALS